MKKPFIFFECRKQNVFSPLIYFLFLFFLFILSHSSLAQWTSTTINTNYSLQKLFFTNDSTGYAAGQNGFTNGVILSFAGKKLNVIS